MKKTPIFFLIAAMLTSPITLAMDDQNTKETKTPEEDNDKGFTVYEEIAFLLSFYLFIEYISEP